MSWTESYHVMLESDGFHYEHKILLDNIQFLHDCRDDRNRDIKQRSTHNFSHNDEHETLETDFAHPPDLNELTELEQGHAILLDDIQRQTTSTASRSTDCMNVIRLAGFADCESVVFHVDPSLVNGTSDLSALRNMWKSEYTSRRKAMKECLRSVDSTSLPTTNTDFGFNSISQLNFDSLDYTQMTSNRSIIIRHLDPSSSHSNLNDSNLCDVICNQWTLNSDQKCAFLIIAQHAFSSVSDTPLTMLISGPAGSGKSQVLTAMRNLFCARNESRRLRCTSYMGIAANNISGVTLHSALNLTPGSSSVHTPLNKSIDELKYMWIGVDYLFIDEVSMISCEFFHTISITLTRATDKPLPFGGLNVIFAGDLAQLPPVAETRLSAWINPKNASASDRTQRKVKGKLLWLSITTVVVLEKINRQSGIENAPFVDLLSRLREGRCNSADYQLLNSRIVSPIQNMKQWNLGFNNFAPIIISENCTKDAINFEMAHTFATKTGQTFHTYTSKDEIDGSPITDSNLVKIIDLIHSGRSSNRLKRLLMIVGMPVMITTNIDLMGGIVNGMLATIRAIDFSILPNGDRVLNHCIVHIPSARAPPMNALADHEYPILPDTITVRYQGSRSKQSLSFK